MFKKSEDDIINNWIMKCDIKVSICCITFNHGNYIEKALDSFLMQETNFPFEIIVHDDASEDKTTEIIKKYHRNFPKIIKPIYQNTNQFSKGNAIYDFVFPLCKGEYIAFCEGDDFWNDQHKLQIQSDFLDNNPDYFISCHDARVVNDQGETITSSFMDKRFMRDLTTFELQSMYTELPTLSRMRRNIDIPFIPERYKAGMNGDQFIISALGHYGKSHFHEDIEPASYRIHRGGVWSYKENKYKLLAILATEYYIQSYLRRMKFDASADARQKVTDRFSVLLPTTFTLFRELIIRLTFARTLKRRLKR